MADSASPGSQGFRTAPEPLTTMPSGIPFIVANEAAERFSYYGMTAILVTFMTGQLCNSAGELATMDEPEARAIFHRFVMAVYFFPVLGALLADVFWGKYRTIITLSIVYCLGHLALALDVTRLGLYIGMGLIALGAGGIKPCVSSHVGDQFGRSNQHLLERVFGWFYLSINLGAMLSQMLIPWLRQHYGPHVAFGLPGVLMFLATIAFWLGRYRYAHIPPGGKAFLREIASPDGRRAVLRLGLIYLCLMPFWALFDQTHSAWVLQAKRMNREFFLGVTIEPDQLQAINPLLILIFVPLFSYFIYPMMNRFFRLTPLRKISLGLFLTVPSFVTIALAERQLQAGVEVHVLWQVLAYVFITAAEVMVSITALEFSYTQSPPKMKSVVMSLYLLSVSAGNLIASLVNSAIAYKPVKEALQGDRYYWFFAGMMLVAALVFIVVAYTYRGQTYIQEEAK